METLDFMRVEPMFLPWNGTAVKASETHLQWVSDEGFPLDFFCGEEERILNYTVEGDYLYVYVGNKNHPSNW